MALLHRSTSQSPPCVVTVAWQGLCSPSKHLPHRVIFNLRYQKLENIKNHQQNITKRQQVLKSLTNFESQPASNQPNDFPVVTIS